MAFGPGRYDDLLTVVREVTNADGAVLLIVGGDLGGGLAVQLPPLLTVTLPSLLRRIADQIEKDGIGVGQ